MRTRPPHLYQSGRGRPLYALHGWFHPRSILSFSQPMWRALYHNSSNSLSAFQVIGSGSQWAIGALDAVLGLNSLSAFQVIGSLSYFRPCRQGGCARLLTADETRTRTTRGAAHFDSI